MDRVTQRPGGRNARIRDAVLDAALAEVVATGGGRISLDAVAERAEVHKSTIYRRWGSSSSLLLDALLTRSDDTVPLPDHGELAADLRELLASVRANLTDPAGRAIAVATTAERDDESAAGARRFWDDRLARAGQLVERAVERGELRDDVDPAAIIEVAVAPLFFRVVVRQGEIDDDLVERVITTIIGSIRPQS